jgi:superfamily II DNA or RNA helicase
MEYADFLEHKKIVDRPSGFEPTMPINPMLFDFQADIVRWALRRGRACIFSDCGTGKTPMQLEYARHVPGNALILAPLAVAAQTVREGAKFGITVGHARHQSEVREKITVTNYEMLHHFDVSYFNAIILDESSILKACDGKTRTAIIEAFVQTPYRLACTATPAPNDFMELGNHAEFCGVMSREEMLSMFFVHDGGETQSWRLKGHAQNEFWQWLCSFCVMLRKPSDLGYDNGNFKLPPLELHEVVCRAEKANEGFLIALPASSLQERLTARRVTLDQRCKITADMVNADKERWLIWCNLNDESAMLKAQIAGAVEVKGSDSDEHKETALRDFADGKIRVLVSKPSIAGFGMNFQACHKMAFVGLSDSYEQYYQAVRRCWRFGQKKTVQAYIVTADIEGAVVENIKRKEREAERMANSMVENMHSINEQNIKGTSRMKSDYETAIVKSDKFTAMLGDCVEMSKTIPDDSIGYTIFSPPFASLYTYSASDRDMGNSKDDGDFAIHFGFLIKELFRVTMPGRLLSFHCMNLPTSKTHHGYIGIRDFRGDLIRMFEADGWIFHSEVCIWKDPVTAMQRTKAIGLLHKQLVKDSALSRQGIPDYLVTMRKPGVNPCPVEGELDRWVGDDSFRSEGRMSIDLWQRYASPVWMDINPSRTLQKDSARDEKDERHICPLQLDVIERGMMLWSNKGDMVLTPFGGIGSEGYIAVKTGRRATLIELKPSYFKQLVANMKQAEFESAEQFLI